MIRLSIDVDSITLVLESYDKIKVYRSTSEGGSYVEITDANTRLDLIPEIVVYYYDDADGDSTKWYKTSYYNSSTLAESPLSAARQGGTETEKIGWTFGNYVPQPGEWGKLLTADDMRYTFIWGVDATASDIAATDFEDEQFDYYIEEALGDFEDFLTVDVRKKVYKTNPADSLIRGASWREGVDYTDLEDAYSYNPMQWQNFGHIQLRHSPIISVDRCILYSQVYGQVIDMIESGWLRVNKKVGTINLYPTGGVPYGPFATGVLPWRMLGGRFPQGFEIDYTTGFPTAEFVPKGLRGIVGKWACIKCLASIGDGLLAGFSSQSVSLDGLSESFSSTQSATSAYFGARIKQYQDEVKEWLRRNRYKWGAIPMSFIPY